jgi:CheY-like chemotaxis protein
VFSAENRVDIPVYAHDTYTPTEAGNEELRSGTTRLPAEVLSLLVMLDGKRTVGDLEQLMPQLAAGAMRNLVRALLAAALVREVTMAEAGDLDIDFAAFFKAAGSDGEPSLGVVASANREADESESQLKRDGYYVSIARATLSPRKPAAGARFSAFLVDDDPDLRALVETLLRDAGLDVSAAASREAVVERLRRKPLPDIVVLDVKLPDLNGFELLQRMKAHPALKAIPVLMLTADASRESIVRGLTLGADGYVTKPFDRAALVRGVKAVLG